MSSFKRYKLPIGIILLIILNFTGLSLTKADVKPPIVNVPEPIKIDPFIVATSKIEDVLNNNQSAKKYLGINIPTVAQTAVALCSVYKSDGLTIPTLMA